MVKRGSCLRVVVLTTSFICRFLPRDACPRERQFSRKRAWFTRFTILLVVYTLFSSHFIHLAKRCVSVFYFVTWLNNCDFRKFFWFLENKFAANKIGSIINKRRKQTTPVVQEVYLQGTINEKYIYNLVSSLCCKFAKIT